MSANAQPAAPIRRSTWAGVVLFLAASAWIATWLDGPRLKAERRSDAAIVLAARLHLTDLALFNEARYTRHPSMADHHAAFQDHPTALDHFPAGSLVPPPAAWRAQPAASAMP